MRALTRPGKSPPAGHRDRFSLPQVDSPYSSQRIWILPVTGDQNAAEHRKRSQW